MTDSKSKNIVLAAGGTGGHIFPALSLAAELISKNYKVTLVTDKRYLKTYPDAPGQMDIRTISSASASGNILIKIKAIFIIILGIIQAWIILNNLKPIAVIGFGGYPSFPTMIASFFIRTKKIIHEQNAVLGRVNRLVIKLVDKVATSFSQVKYATPQDQAKIVFTGNPVRQSIKAIRASQYPQIQANSNINILITGGSQGTKLFSELVPNAILMLPGPIKNRLIITQQCRKEDLEEVTTKYKNAGIKCNLAAFFDNLAKLLEESNLVIGRAGASTLAELTVAGRPAILIPFMQAMDDHQTVNPQFLVDKGGAILLPQKNITPEILAGKLETLLKDPENLATMAKNSRDMGMVDATNALAKVVLDK